MAQQVRYVADDGSVFDNKEEMDRMNAKVERLLLPDKIRRTFALLQASEQAAWIFFNIAKRNIRFKLDEYGLRVYA